MTTVSSQGSGKESAANLAPATSAGSPAVPSRDEALAVLSRFERTAFRLVERMNRGTWKEFWIWCQREIGARWIGHLARRQLREHGFEHVERTSAERPLLLVANHRSYFDLFVVTEILFRRLEHPIRINFPIRGRGYYQSPSGLVLNFVGGFWAMFPPLFARPSHQVFDRYAVDLLIRLCREGPGNVIGIHPEGGRNKDPDPYSFRKLQPGTGRIIHAARPQVIPVFVTGLDNSLMRHLRNWLNPRETVRVHFGPEPDLSAFYAMPAKGSTYKAITEHVMERVRELAEQDRSMYGRQPGATAGET